MLLNGFILLLFSSEPKKPETLNDKNFPIWYKANLFPKSNDLLSSRKFRSLKNIWLNNQK